MKLKKFFKYFANVIFVVLLFFGLLILVTVLPITDKISLLTVRSGSMEPAIKTGSLIVIASKSDYDIGDVVTRMTDEENVTVTHRIIEKKIDGGKIVFKTKGDANKVDDNAIVSLENIVGKVYFDIPYLGYLVSYAKTSKGLFVFVIIPALIIIIDEMFKIDKEISKRRQRKKSIKSNVIDLKIKDENKG